MAITWILVANSSRAHLYATHKAKLLQSNGKGENELELLKEFNHEQSRMKGEDLITDGPGRYRTTGGGHGSFVPETDPKEEEAEKFAIEIAHELEEERRKGKFKDLAIVATPHFHGLLNKHLGNELIKLVTSSVEKDYTRCNQRDLATHLSKEL